MKSVRRHWMLAGLLASAGFAAFAQAPAAPAAPGAQPPRHERKAMDPVKMKEFIAKRQAALKEKLRITPAQESAWTTFTATMQPPARGQRPAPGEFAKLTTPERIDKMQAMRAQRAAEMDKRLSATKTFYAALTPEQQKVFDAETLRRGGRHHGGPGGPGHRG